MDSEAAPRHSDLRNFSAASPMRLNFPHKRRSNSEVAEELRQQNESLQKRVSDLETEVERLQAENSRSHRRVAELKAKHMDHLQELTARLSRSKANLPESLEAALSEKMTSVTSLHKELLEELNNLQTKTERKIKSKEMDLQQNFNAKLAMLGRQMEKRKTAIGSPQGFHGTERDSEAALGAKMQRFEEFNTKLQATNKFLRQKLKEAETLAEVYAAQHSSILLENAKLKKALQERQSPTPARTPHCEDLPLIVSTKARTPAVSPTSEGLQTDKMTTRQKELITRKGQLVQERLKRTELAQILESCLEDIKAQIASVSGRSRDDLTAKEREVLVKSLMEKERVISLFQTQAFPSTGKAIMRSASVVLLRK